MGKYIRKEKTSPAGDLSPIELTQSSLGVRTRAKTLALQRLQKSPAADGSYLQLRSRTLVKSPVFVAGDSKRQRQGAKGNPNSRTGLRLKNNSVNSGSDGLGSPAKKIEIRLETERAAGGGKGDANCGNNIDSGVEASFGENVLELEGRDHRSSRENTPCSLIRDPECVGTPGSTTKPARSSEGNRQVQNSMRNRNVPASCDMDEFFSGPEKQQQEQFMDKYNFDPVNEKPLPGHYEWVKLDW